MKKYYLYEIVVRDDIEYGHAPFVPLWHFGLTY